MLLPLLAAFMACGTLLIASLSSFSTFHASQQMTVGAIPASIVVAKILRLGCSAVLVFGAMAWHRKQWRRGAVAVGLVMLIVFVGLRILHNGPQALLQPSKRNAEKSSGTNAATRVLQTGVDRVVLFVDRDQALASTATSLPSMAPKRDQRRKYRTKKRRQEIFACFLKNLLDRRLRFRESRRRGHHSGLPTTQ